MGKVLRFKRPPPFRSLLRGASRQLGVPPSFIPGALVIMALIGIFAAETIFTPPFPSDVSQDVRVLRPDTTANEQWVRRETPAPDLLCSAPLVVDGDTFDCGSERVRLTSIDAPEMEAHCRPGRACVAGDPLAARNHLVRLTRGQVACDVLGTGYYGRAIARCRSAGQDLSCAMVRGGHAVPRYGGAPCES